MFHDAVRGDMETLVNAFWKSYGGESAHTVSGLLHDLAPYELAGEQALSALPLAQTTRRGRFDIAQKTKKLVIVSPSGIGKSAVIKLFRNKLSALVRKNSSFCNIAVFWHQIGRINTTTLFSAWFSVFHQTLFSIAETLAESGNPQAVACLQAMSDDDCAPIVHLLSAFLPAELRPYTSLLSLVGIKFQSARGDQSPGLADSVAHADDPLTESRNPHSDGPGLNSSKPAGDEEAAADPLGALEPSERLQRCADVIIAVIQLHVKLTRKITVYIMDDLQHHDAASQDLCRILGRTATGVCLLSTYRTSQAFSSLSGDPSHAHVPSIPPRPSDQPRLLDGSAQSSYEAAIQTMQPSNEFRRMELRPLNKTACKQLLTHIFGDCGVPTVPEGVLEALHSLSAGSPLYAIELAKTVCDSFVRGADARRDRRENEALLSAIIVGLRTDRIEEIVRFRFDKLPELCQLVLKMAAVSAVDGSHFTLSMLTFIADSGDHGGSQTAHASEMEVAGDADDVLHSRVDIVQAINDLLEMDEFIENRGDLTSHSSAKDVGDDCGGNSYTALLKKSSSAILVAQKSNVSQLMRESSSHNLRSERRDSSTLQQLQFHWKVDMELRAIYDLMLDDQKESLHDKVASYLELRLDESDSMTATEWTQQAFHWKRATSWSRAMTCYYQAGMLLKEQGDSSGCKRCFTEAYQMLEKMRGDAGPEFLDKRISLATPSADAAPGCGALPVLVRDGSGCDDASSARRTEEQIKRLAVAGMGNILRGRNSGLSAQDVHKIFEGSSQLFSTGIAVLVRLAQTLIGPGTTALSFRLFEEAMDMALVLRASPVTLAASDGKPFCLLDKAIFFQTISGMFLLLLNEQVADSNKLSRLEALVSLAMDIAKLKPEYEAHLVHAHILKIRLLERFLHQDPSSAGHILRYADALVRLYQPDKHSQELIHSYNSDRVASALGAVAKLLCMQGRFSESLKFVELAKQISAKLTRFFSHAMGMVGIYAPIMLYFPDLEAHRMFQKFSHDATVKQSQDFQGLSPILVEGITQVLRSAGGDAASLPESAAVEGKLQSRGLVQKHEIKFALNMMRFFNVGVEFVAARICYFKAVRCGDLHQSDPELAAAHRGKAAAYLQLGLEHLTFMPAQDAQNEEHLFSNLHEKLLRAQLLMKKIEYGCCPEDSDNRELCEEALRNLQYCAAVGKRGDLHGILLQTGAHLVSLAGLLRSVAAGAATEAASTDIASDTRADLGESLVEEGGAMQAAALVCIRKCNSEDVNLEGIFAAMLIRLSPTALYK